MTQAVPTIVLVDDAPEVRTLVRTSLRLTGDLEVVGEGGNGAEAIALAREHHPALMLLDASMPVMDGLQALPSILEESPNTKVLMYSGFEEQGLAEKAVALGAAGFVPKAVPIDTLSGRLLGALNGDSTDGSAPHGVDSAGVDAEHQLNEHLERFREVFDQAAIGMATMTLTGQLVRVNAALAALVSRRGEELIGTSYADLTRGEGAAIDTVLEQIIEDHHDVVELEHGLKEADEQHRVRATFAPVRDAGGRPLYLFLQAQDVTAERVAVEQLRRSEERFRLLVEAVQDYAIFMLDPDGHIVSWNIGAQRIKGYTAEEIVGRHFRTFYPPEVQAAKHPEHELQLAVRDGHYEEEGWRIRKDGSRFWANVLITAVFNSEGEHIGFTKVTRDTTERRKLEQEREGALEALAVANGELAALNERLERTAADQARFLAVAAHELRTPVNVLGGTADMLTKHWEQLDDVTRNELLAGMESSTQRLRRLLEDLLTASKLDAGATELRREPVSVNRLVADAVSAVRRTWPDAHVEVDADDGLTMTGDGDRLAQVLDNLLTNAMRHGAPPV
ncbi:MAG: PAS domain S-box protein, partial [Nocardioides sp.]